MARKPSTTQSADSGGADADALNIYLQQIGKTPLLTRQEEVELAGRIHAGDEKAREQMIRANLRLVVKIARDYSGFGLPLLDLISEGNIGLMKAVERFDPEKGGKLSTYGSWWIKQAIKRALANQGKTIRLPVHLVDRISKMRKLIMRMTETLGREPNNDEIAAEMGLPVHKIAHLKTIGSRPASLDAPVGGGNSSGSADEETDLGEMVSDELAINPQDELWGKSLMADLHLLLDELSEREATIVRMRFGIGYEHPLILDEVGDAIGITRERVRQIQNEALMKIRRALTERERGLSMKERNQANIDKKRSQVLNEFFAKKLKAKEAAE